MNKRNLVIALAVGVVIVAAIVLVRQDDAAVNSDLLAGNNPAPAATEPAEPVASVEENVEQPPPVGSAKKTTSGGKPAATNYTELVKQYEGRRIQIDDACQMHPFESTYKVGTSLMFDNRSRSAHKIVVDAKTYTLSAYHYQIIHFSSEGLRYIDCDAQEKVLTLRIQK